MGGRVYSLMARMRSLSGSHLAQSILGMTSLYSLAISSGITVRIEGSARDIDPLELAEMFVQTTLLPMLGDVHIEVQMVTATSVQRLSQHLKSSTIQQQWMRSVAHHIVPSILITQFDALDSVCRLLLTSMAYVPIDDVVELYLVLCCASMRIEKLKQRQKMLKSISTIVVHQCMLLELETNAKGSNKNE